MELNCESIIERHMPHLQILENGSMNRSKEKLNEKLENVLNQINTRIRRVGILGMPQIHSNNGLH